MNSERNSPFEHAIAALPVIVWEMDWGGPEGTPRLSYVSASIERVLGYPAHLWLEDPEFLQSVLHPEDRERMNNSARKDVVGSILPVQLFRCIAADGRTVWMEGRWALTLDGSGQAVGLQGVNIDVTDRRLAEEALRDSEERYRRITEASAEGIVAIDAHGHATYINRRVTELLGYTIEDLRGLSVLGLMDPPNEKILAVAARQSTWDNSRYHEVGLRHRDGSKVWVSVAISPDYREDGSFDSALCLLTDISEQKRAGEALQRSEGKYRRLADTATDIVIRYDRDLRCLYANRAIESVIGVEPSRLIGRTMSQLGVPADKVDFWRRQILRTLDSGREHSLEYDYNGATGRRHLQTVLVPEFSEDGSAATCMLVTRDLTERQRLEERQQFLAEANVALSTSLEYEVTIRSVTRLVVPRLADGCLVVIFEDDSVVPTAASAHAAHVDPAKEPILRQLRLRPPSLTAGSGRLMAVLQGGHAEEEYEAGLDTWVTDAASGAQAPDLLRSLGIVSSMTVPLTARGRTIGAMMLFSAESGRRYTRDDLLLAEDLARRCALAMDNARLYREVRYMNQAKDEFLAVLSHELRNPLAAICNALQATALDECPARAFQEIQTELEREVRGMSRLVEDLLDVSRISRGRIQLRPEPRDLGAVIRSAARASRAKIAERGHTLLIDTGPEPLTVHADPVRLEQVFSNLLNNAAKYTPPGGTIRVEVSRDDGMAQIRFIDNGIGIAPESIPLLFRPFYQVDPQREATEDGLGLGLSLVRSLVHMHGGSVEARSEGTGLGCEFIVRWPLAEIFGLAGFPAAPILPEAEDSHDQDGQDGQDGQDDLDEKGGLTPRRILLVEDNVFSARMLARILTEAGHNVRMEADGPSAIAAAEQEAPEIVLLDIGLPMMDGYEVAQRLRAMPGLDGAILVALTGYGREEDRERAFSSGFDHHLIKPVDFQALLNLLAGNRERVKGRG